MDKTPIYPQWPFFFFGRTLCHGCIAILRGLTLMIRGNYHGRILHEVLKGSRD